MENEVYPISIAPFCGVISIQVEKTKRWGLFPSFCLTYEIGWAAAYRGEILARTVVQAIRKLFKKISFVQTVDSEETLLKWAKGAEKKLNFGYTRISYSKWY